VLVLVMHHIVSDGWSMNVLIQELDALYGAAVEGRRLPLRELPIQYPRLCVVAPTVALEWCSRTVNSPIGRRGSPVPPMA